MAKLSRKVPFFCDENPNLVTDEKGGLSWFFCAPLPSNLHSRKPKYFCLSHLFQEKIEKGKETFNYNSRRRREIFIFCQERGLVVDKPSLEFSRNNSFFSSFSPWWEWKLKLLWGQLCSWGGMGGCQGVGIFGQVAKFRHFKSTSAVIAVFQR